MKQMLLDFGVFEKICNSQRSWVKLSAQMRQCFILYIECFILKILFFGFHFISMLFKNMSCFRKFWIDKAVWVLWNFFNF